MRRWILGGILFQILFLATGSSLWAQSVVTQTASNENSTSFVMRGYVNPQGTNTLTWFEWGTDEYLATSTAVSNQNIGAGSTNVFIAARLTGIYAGTRVYFRAAASNAVNGVVRGSIDNGVTTQVSYDDTTPDFDTLDETRPYGGEPGSVWDDAERQTRGWAKGFLATEHVDGGYHKPGFVVTAYIGDGQVTLAKLAPDALAGMGGGGGTNGTNAVSTLVTNAFTYIGSVDSDGTEIQITQKLSQQILGTLVIPSNTFRKVEVRGEVLLKNLSNAHRSFTLYVRTGGVVRQTYTPLAMVAGSSMLVPVRALVDGGNTDSVTADAQAWSDASSLQSTVTATLKSIELTGLP